LIAYSLIFDMKENGTLCYLFMSIPSQNVLLYIKSVVPSTSPCLVLQYRIQVRSQSSPPANYLTGANLQANIIIINPVHLRFPILANRGDQFASTIILILRWKRRVQVSSPIEMTLTSQHRRRMRRCNRRWNPLWRLNRRGWRTGWHAFTMLIAGRVLHCALHVRVCDQVALRGADEGDG